MMKIEPQHDQWAHIIEDLLHEIAQHIDSFLDYVRFRLTCKNWYAKLPSSKYFNYPLLLLPSEHKSDSVHPIFHPEIKRVIYHLSLPEIKDTLYRGSCYGWLIIVGLDDTTQMFNPVKRIQIHLPPISTIPTVISYQPERRDEEYTLKTSDGFTFTLEKWDMQTIFHKVILSCPPDDETQDFMAVAIAIFDNTTNLCYYKRGDKIWTRLSNVSNICFEDVIFHEGKIYVVDYSGFIYEFDMKTTLGGLSRRPSYDNNVRTYINERLYIVQSCGGLHLVVKRGKCIQVEEGDMENEKLCTLGFNVFKLDESQNKWLEVKTLNDYMLVLGYNSSICVMPNAISRNKGNCIYYSDDWVEFQHDQTKGGYDNGVFDFKDGTIHPVFSGPNLIFPAPIWLL